MSRMTEVWGRWNLQVMLLEVLHWWCPLRAVFSIRGFRAAHGPPAKVASPVQALIPTDSIQLSLQKVFLYSRPWGQIPLGRSPWAEKPALSLIFNLIPIFRARHTHTKDKISFPPSFRRQRKLNFSSSQLHPLLFSCFSCSRFSLIASLCYKLGCQSVLENCDLL